MRRSELREHVFKLLFMKEFNDETQMPEQMAMYFDGMEELEEKDQSYMENRFLSIQKQLPAIDRLLNETSRGWKTARMNRVDLAVLRLAVYELCFDEEVPTGVAINEAVLIAKKFGGEESGAFVNGILGKIAVLKEEGALSWEKEDE